MSHLVHLELHRGRLDSLGDLLVGDEVHVAAKVAELGEDLDAVRAAARVQVLADELLARAVDVRRVEGRDPRLDEGLEVLHRGLSVGSVRRPVPAVPAR